jgi:ABC-2 type transport system permease protein
MRLDGFSLRRWVGIMVKEFIQLRRDRLTFGMIIGIPVIQLLLFGFAINADPKFLPTAVLAQDNSQVARTLVSALQASKYFEVVRHAESEAEIESLFAHGKVQFALTIPPGAAAGGGRYRPDRDRQRARRAERRGRSRAGARPQGRAGRLRTR